MQAIIDVFSYINSLGASVMMPIILTIIGVVLGAKFGKALRGGLTVGIGFIGLNLVTGLMGENLAPAVQQMAQRFGLALSTVDIGWPAASAIAFGTTIGLIVNIVMLLTNTTQTLDVDIWNYWHFAFTGSLIYVLTGNFAYGIIAAILNMVIIMVIGDYTAPKVEETLGMPGVSLPHGFTAAFVPIAIVVDKIIDVIPGVKNINIDIEKLQKRFGVFGEPMLVGTVLGIIIAALAGNNVQTVLQIGVTLGAVMVLIPKMAALLMEGLMPISDAAQEFVSSKFANRGKIYIGLDSAVGVGHPVCLTVSLILVPLAVFLAVILPGNTVLPMTDLSVLPYMFVLIVPLVGGNGFRALITGIVCLVGGLYISTNLAPSITAVAKSVNFAIPKGAATISSICDGANPLSWVLVKAHSVGAVGLIIAVAVAVGLALMNRKRIIKEAKELHADA
ncbi:PTS galactitol transporter subunit IIC [Anaerostipes sp. CAG:276]|uniref:PTS galactitol transporter subunit IIC n=1 Tax=Anaerostipes sp. CAG:276 TaxID=1262699 RepID=UPI00033DC94D|nr:PTS transporter subunit IIC [Anaerostipes sp. CAG:276]CDC34894.1 pTS system protein [Anaerostipes sp. CAG:276]